MSIRGDNSYPQSGFGGGLDLRSKTDSVDPTDCIDAMNVYFSERGAVVQRKGFDNLTSSGLTNRVASLEPFYTTGGTKQLLAGCGTRLEALNTSGAVVASATGLTSAIWDFARFGQPNAEVAYAGNGTDTLRKWNGTEWTAPTAEVNGEKEKAMPKAGAICIWPGGGNRLVATGFSTTTGGPNGATSSPSHVYFSDVGDPESWTNKEGEENYIQLSPGDGEKIMAVVAWREFVFVFKETKFFVLYSAAGNPPEFAFRPVEAGVGLASSRAVCIQPSGVYFMGRHGVYRTTGQEPEEVSQRVEPLWSGETSPFYNGETIAHGSITNCAMGTWEDRIYLAFPTSSTNNRILVYDPQFSWWSLYNIPASCLTSFRPSSREELVFGYASGEQFVGRHSTSYTNDDGAAIASHWRSGWFDLENPDVKTIRASKLWGTGKCFVGLGIDFEQGTGTLDALDFSDPTADKWGGTTWGGGEWAEERGLVQKSRRRAVRGTTFSLYLTNETLDQEWSLHRTVHHLREVAKPERVTA